MAKKKLSDYQKARREFVQRRATGMGGDVTQEQKQQFRKRFDVLASTKQGRTQLAQRALPTGGPEERRDYKRMLATELPARGNVGNGTSGGGSSPYKRPTASEITAGWQQAIKSGSYKVPTRTAPASKSNINVRGGVGSTQYGPQYSPSKSNVQKAQDLWSNRRNNIIGKGIDFPGRAALDRITNPLTGSGKFGVDPGIEYTPKGIVKAVGTEAAEAILLAGGGGAKTTATVLGGTKKVLQFGLKKVGQAFFQQAKNTTKNTGTKATGTKATGTKATGTKGTGTKGTGTKGTGTKTGGTKSPGRKLPDTKTSSTKTPGRKLPDTKATTTKTPSTKTSSTKTSSTKTPGRKLPDTKPAVTKEKPPVTKEKPPVTKEKPPVTKEKPPVTKEKPPVTKEKPPATKEKPLSKSAAKKAEDTKLSLGIRQQKYPKAGEKDLDFILRVENAQDIVTNQKQNWYQYSQWLQSSQTQARLRALRGK